MKKILISVRPWESRVAILENKHLQNIYFNSKHNAQLERSFIKGKIIKILPGVETAFVDINQEKAGFLHISEIDRTLVRERISGARDDITLEREEVNDDIIHLDKQYLKNVNISDILREGEDLLVQVSKEPINAKGAKLTTCFSIPGRFLILMPNIPKIGISKKIMQGEERRRLKDVVLSVLPEKVGCIIRTTSENKSEDDIKADAKYLLHQLDLILAKYKKANIGDVLYQDINVIYQVVRDNLSDKVEVVECDDEVVYNQLINFVEYHCAEFVDKIRLFKSEEQSLFDFYHIEKQIQKSLHSKVELSNGASIVLESTEAMTVIDVNTARFIGNNNLDETLFKTNIEAAKEIVRQLRLRNIGGLIVIDFIDMTNYAHKNKLFAFFERTLKEEDRSQSVVLKISEFGLVQMTRKRTGKTPREQLMQSCAHCNGTGYTKSLVERAYELLRILERDIKDKKIYIYKQPYTCVVTVNVSLAQYLLQNEYEGLLYFKKTYKVTIVINESDDSYLNAYHFEWIVSKGDNV